MRSDSLSTHPRIIEDDPTMESSPLLAIIIIAIISLISATWFTFYRTRRNEPFPPGPKGLPLAGNLLDIPSEKEWLTFAKWGEIYGDILSISILGRRMVVINSAQTAIDILEKKSIIYSERPVMGMAGELVGFKNALVLLSPGTRFRNQRRLTHQQFGSSAAIKQFSLIVESETRRLLKRLSDKPEHLAEHIRTTTGAIVLRIIYGYEVQQENDLFVEMVDKVTQYFALSMTPGSFLANPIPMLRHIPDWFPGAGFKQIAKEWRSTTFLMIDTIYDFVKQQMATGKACVSFTSKLLESGLNMEKEFDIKWLAATLHGAGADTTVAAIYAFFKAMLLFPDVQTKAQAEIDAVVGNDRLPQFDDREHLAYINALVLEVSRWHTVAPLAVPHSVRKDDVHSGYLIKKGTLVLPNIWKMLHDPVVYKEPFDFNPERFIRTKDREPEADPYKVAFGFGRRICPGRLLADSSIFIVCAMVLAVFDISKYSENGVILEPDTGHTAGNISHPTPFKCMIKARSERALDLINRESSV
ncbi:cytochrome P450 [Desarmillaria tabescens]|uniref:Cytochrome P450 n=1 Tax=Armillaria tabescens TaxID=1929756 RepID=A0AA39MGW6_ARMTA|nr:cytochrome P450 [Desarmillaria tabescens]KAK0434401.1 cytochrome P450 [Desarmillaria tabescens]